MRDIRPIKKAKKQPPAPVEPDNDADDAKPAKRTTTGRLAGSKVGVHSIEVPKAAEKKVVEHTPTLEKTPVGPKPGVTPPSKKAATFLKPRLPQFRTPRVGQRERMILFVLLGLVAVIGVLAVILFLPRADIRLVLRTAPLLVDETLSLQAGDVSSEGIVPASAFFREVLVEGTSPVAGTRVIGEPASGTVSIVNRTVEEQSIKEQSRLETEDGVLFYMQKGVTIPAASGAPTSVAVEIVAAEAGEQGNIEPQRLNFPGLPEESRPLLYAELGDTLTGGSGDTVPFVGEDDLLGAQQHAGSEARAMVEDDIRAELPDKWTILEESWTGEISDFNTPVGLESEESAIPYRARVIVRALAYEEEVLEGQLRSALETRMQDEYMLFPGDISYSKNVEAINWEEQAAELSARVTHTTIPRFSLETLRDKLSGQSAGAAREYLEGLPGVRSAQLSLSPFWVGSVPRIHSRVHIELTPERQP